jgi:hypothetical protein
VSQDSRSGTIAVSDLFHFAPWAIWCIALQRKPECFREDIRTTENLAELEVRREKLIASSTPPAAEIAAMAHHSSHG